MSGSRKAAGQRAAVVLTALAALAACLPLAALAGRAEIDEAQRQVIERTNAFRQEQGLDTVTSNLELEKAAGEFARFMARSGRYGHEADGRRPAQRANAHGYEFCIVSENLSQMYRSTGYDAAALARDMVEGWKNSPAHRRNLVEPAVTEIGVGVARSDDDRYFGVQMFGRPKSAAIRFTIANESGRPIDYRAGEQPYSLDPRAARTHTVCMPMAITIEMEEPFSTRPGDGARYTVIDRAGSLAVTAGP